MRELNRLFIGVTALAATSCSTQIEERTTPNVIYILADDLGYGDLSCFGQQHFKTPHIDQLASEGMRFTQHYAGSAVSAPSRSVLLSGLHTGHTYIRGNRELKDAEGQHPIPAEAYLLPEMFKEAGYATGAFGKWGLGFPGSEGDPNNQGFDEFFGYNCQRQAHRYYPPHLWHNQEKYILEGNDNKNCVTFAPDVIQEQALKFIRTNANRPFFAYIPIVQPHAELLAPDDELLEQFKGKFEETPYIAPKAGANYGSEKFNPSLYASQPIPRATFAAMVSRVDRYVGEVMSLLTELGIDDNTIVIFSSDNGPHREGGADPDFFDSNGDVTGYKRSMTDGGIRVPMIAYWRGKIAAGTTSLHVSSFCDMLPTFAEVAGVELPIESDGISMIPTFTGEGEQREHEFLFWELTMFGGDNIAVRMGDWKGIKYKVDKRPDAPMELYNLRCDISESVNVAKQNPEVVAQIEEIILREHTPNKNFPFVLDK